MWWKCWVLFVLCKICFKGLHLAATLNGTHCTASSWQDCHAAFLHGTLRTWPYSSQPSAVSWRAMESRASPTKKWKGVLAAERKPSTVGAPHDLLLTLSKTSSSWWMPWTDHREETLLANRCSIHSKSTPSGTMPSNICAASWTHQTCPCSCRQAQWRKEGCSCPFCDLHGGRPLWKVSTSTWTDLFQVCSQLFFFLFRWVRQTMLMQCVQYMFFL